MTTEADKLMDIHQKALVEFNTIFSAVHEERKQNLEDRRFYSIAGAQWEGELAAQFENKPKFEVNKIHLSVIRIINEYRNNRITVDFTSEEGVEDDTLADTCDGLYRANEEDSVAEEAYDNAFEEAVGGGFGAWRLRTEYVDEGDIEDERQKILIEPIFDADTSVFFDLQSKRQDKSDAKHCFVLTAMTPEAYEEEYDDDPSTWPKTVNEYQFDWNTPDAVYVAEYYKAEETKDKVFIYEDIQENEERHLESELGAESKERLRVLGFKKIRTKRIKKTKIHKYILSGSGVLDDVGLIAGDNIPIIQVYGKRWYVDGIERSQGHVRLAKDAQRLKNMQLSKLGSISALSSISKPILSPEQIAGHQLMWSDDNVKDYPYLLINPITDPNGNEILQPPIGYTKSPEIPPAMAALLQITEEDIQDLLGNQQNGEEIQGNVSTETAHLIQNRLDMQTFIYLSNMAKAIKRCGHVWLGIAREVFVEEGRKIKTIDSQGDKSRATLKEPYVNADGKTIKRNDLSKAKFDVGVTVGPSSSTKRAATVRSLNEMLRNTQDPDTRQVLESMIMLNMEGEGISEVRKFFRRKLVRMQVIEPNDQEKKELAEEQANQEPTPQDQYLESAAKNEESKSVESQSKTILNQAKADESRANAAETLAGIDIKEGEQALKVIEQFGPRAEPPTPST